MYCTVHLPNYPNEYYSGGSIIKGTVVCTISQQIDITGVFVKLKGKERNEWEEGYGVHKKIYSDKNKFLRIEHVLQKKGTLGPGIFEYPFSFQLPLDIPDSFKGPFGCIRYTVDSEMDVPCVCECTNKKEITVLNSVDFNSEQYRIYRGPAVCSETKFPSSWCCNDGAITMDVCLEKRGIVPGEAVKMKVLISNQSNTDVDIVRVKISRSVRAFVLSSFDSKHRDSFEVVAVGTLPGVKARDEKIYNADLPIPANLRVLNFQGSKLFQEETILSVKACFAWHTNMDVGATMIFGDIPYRSPHYQNRWPALPVGSSIALPD